MWGCNKWMYASRCVCVDVGVTFGCVWMWYSKYSVCGCVCVCVCTRVFVCGCARGWVGGWVRWCVDVVLQVVDVSLGRCSNL